MARLIQSVDHITPFLIAGSLHQGFLERGLAKSGKCIGGWQTCSGYRQPSLAVYYPPFGELCGIMHGSGCILVYVLCAARDLSTLYGHGTGIAVFQQLDRGTIRCIGNNLCQPV